MDRQITEWSVEDAIQYLQVPGCGWDELEKVHTKHHIGCVNPKTCFTAPDSGFSSLITDLNAVQITAGPDLRKALENYVFPNLLNPIGE